MIARSFLLGTDLETFFALVKYDISPPITVAITVDKRTDNILGLHKGSA